MPNKLFNQKVVTLVTGSLLLIAGIVMLSLCIMQNNKATNAQNNNSSKGHLKVKNDQCKVINKGGKVGLTGLFCNANTPSTWKNDQDFAKKFYPKDMDHQAKLYSDNKTPAPFYSDIALYGERERQVESAQLFGKFQGQMQGGIALNITIIIFGLVLILVGISSN